MSLLHTLAKPFLGSGLTVKYPFIGRVFSWFYRLSGSHLVDRPIPLGLTLRIPANDQGIGLTLESTGQWEPLETATLLGVLRAGQTCFDVGANVGYYSLLAAAVVGPSGRVVAFEPDRRNLALLEGNLRLNGLTNVTIVEQAVSRSSGAAVLMVSSFDPSRHTIVEANGPKGDERRQITSVSLDEWCETHGIYPDVMKIDIEGAEGLLVEGGRRVLADPRVRTVLMEFVAPRIAASGVDPAALLSTLSAMGFEIFQMDERRGVVEPLPREAWATGAGSYQIRNLLLQKPETGASA